MSRKISKISSKMDSEDEDDVLDKPPLERQKTGFGSASKGGGFSNAADKLKKLLPEGYDEFRILSASTKVENDIESIYGWFRLPLATKEDVAIWLIKFQKKTSTTYKPFSPWEKGTGNLFKRKYVCTYEPQNEHTNSCPACLIFSIKDLRAVETDPEYYLRAQPAQVVIHFNHNHFVPEVSSQQKSFDLSEIFNRFFLNHHSPTSALICHKCDLHSYFGPKFYTELTKPSVYPSFAWCSKFYDSMFRKRYQEPKVRELYDMLTDMIDKKSTFFSETRAFLTICTPLMRNVFLALNQEVISVRSITYLKKNRKVLVFVSHTPIGILPFGVMVILHDDIESVIKAIRALLLLLKFPDFSPKTIIVDEDLVTLTSLQRVFANSKIIYNEFRMLQMIWRNVRSVCKEQEEDYQGIYEAFLLCLQSGSEKLFYNRLKKVENLIKPYPSMKGFFDVFQDKAACYVEYAKPQVHINEDVLSCTDSGTTILKDVCTKYSETFNVCQLYDFIVNYFNKHYERKLLRVTKGKINGFYRTFFYVPLKETEGFKCEQINEAEFRVSCSSQEFYVNSELDACTCNYSSQGSTCIHQYIMEKQLDLQPESYTHVDEQTIRVFKKILSGNCERKNDNSKVIETTDQSSVEQFQRETDELLTQYKVMDNGMLVTEEDFKPKINVLSTVVIKEAPDDKLILESFKGSANIEITDFDVEEMDSDGVDELASQTDFDSDILQNLPKGMTVRKTEIMNTAVNQLTDLAKNNKCDVEGLLGKLQDPQAKEEIATALKDEFSSDPDEDELRHYSDCPSSCSDFHSELEEVSDYDDAFMDSDFVDSEDPVGAKPIPLRNEDMGNLPRKKKLVKHTMPNRDYSDSSDEEYEQQRKAKTQLKRIEMASGVSLVTRSSGSFDSLKTKVKSPRKQDSKMDLKKLQSILMDGDSLDSLTSEDDIDTAVPLEKNAELKHLFNDNRVEMLVEEDEEYLYETWLSDFDEETLEEVKQEPEQKYFLVGNTVMAFDASKPPNKDVTIKSLKKPPTAKVNGDVNKTSPKSKIAKIEKPIIDDQDDFENQILSYRIENKNARKREISDASKEKSTPRLKKDETPQVDPIRDMKNKLRSKMEMHTQSLKVDVKKENKLKSKIEIPTHNLKLEGKKENKLRSKMEIPTYTVKLEAKKDNKLRSKMEIPTHTVKLEAKKDNKSRNKMEMHTQSLKVEAKKENKSRSKMEKLEKDKYTPKIKHLEVKTKTKLTPTKQTKAETKKIGSVSKDKLDRRKMSPTTETPVKRNRGRPKQIKTSPDKITNSKSPSSEFEKFLQQMSTTKKRKRQVSVETDDSEIIPVAKPTKRKYKKRAQKQDNLELLVLLERNVEIEMRVKKHVKMQKKRRTKIVPKVKTGLKSRRKGRGLEELLARARSSKFLY